MATKSIMKNIDVRDTNLGRSLVSALEKAKGKKSKDVVLSRSYKELHGDKILKALGKE